LWAVGKDLEFIPKQFGCRFLIIKWHLEKKSKLLFCFCSQIFFEVQYCWLHLKILLLNLTTFTLQPHKVLPQL